MFDYFAIAWDSKSEDTNAAASELKQRVGQRLSRMRTCFERDGLQVWCTPVSVDYQVYPINSEGVVVGTLFKNDSSHVSSETFTRGYVSSMGNVDSSTIGCLCSAYWGRFVGFSRDTVTGSAIIFRDPSGFMNCLRTSWKAVQIFCSDVADCKDVGLSFSVDWEFVAAHISSWKARGIHTALKEAKYLPPGCYVVVEKGVLREGRFWDPIQISLDSVRCERDAEELLYGAVTRSVSAWASLHRKVIIHLSGGLDSSIVAGCVRHMKPEVELYALNYYSTGAISDERDYAREVAGFLTCPIIERERTPQVDLAKMLSCRSSARLDFNVMWLETSSVHSELSRSLSATAILSGSGGDQIFGSGLNALSGADYARRRPFGPKIFELCKQAALLERRSIWNVLGGAYRYGVRREAFDPQAEYKARMPLVTDKAKQFALRRELEYHPWRAAGSRLPPGKLSHLALLVNRLTGDALVKPGDADMLDPLMSTRAVEAALRIPTYFLFRDGWDRGLARKAFCGLIPNSIAQRASKGGTMEHMLSILAVNLPFLRSLLVGGVLAQRGFVDEREIRQALSHEGASRASLMDILQIATAEARLLSWVSR